MHKIITVALPPVLALSAFALGWQPMADNAQDAVGVAPALAHLAIAGAFGSALFLGGVRYANARQGQRSPATFTLAMWVVAALIAFAFLGSNIGAEPQLTLTEVIALPLLVLVAATAHELTLDRVRQWNTPSAPSA